MIVADQNGVFSRVLVDFGPKHIVIDKDGEDVGEVMIRSIESVTSEKEPTQRAKITLIEGATHGFSEQDQVSLKEVVGMKSKSGEIDATVNGQTYTILEVNNRNSFVIDCDMTQFTEYERDGLAKQVKTRVEVAFKPLKAILTDFSDATFDDNLKFMDFEKI
jgi:hypothetical protein